jgi:hypothetical protein
MDGIPINDSGNYAVYPNLLGDAENLEQIFVTWALPRLTARILVPAAVILAL